jgi:hypothetical protein
LELIAKFIARNPHVSRNWPRFQPRFGRLNTAVSTCEIMVCGDQSRSLSDTVGREFIATKGHQSRRRFTPSAARPNRAPLS